MSTTQEPGSLYWSVIEPHWSELTETWEDIDAFLRACRSVPRAVLHLYAAHWCQSEVNNGGLYQFFYNSTGVLAPEAADGFEAIGLPQTSSIIKEAISYFGVPFPRDRVTRLTLLPDGWVGERNNWDPFTALDERFYDSLEVERDLWETRADKYAADA